MNELQQVLNDIKQDKNTNLLPGNLRDNVTCLGVEGTAEVPEPIYTTTDYRTVNIPSPSSQYTEIYHLYRLDSYLIVSWKKGSYGSNYYLYKKDIDGYTLLGDTNCGTRTSYYGCPVILGYNDKYVYVIQAQRNSDYCYVYPFNLDTNMAESTISQYQSTSIADFVYSQKDGYAISSRVGSGYLFKLNMNENPVTLDRLIQIPNNSYVYNKHQLIFGYSHGLTKVNISDSSTVTTKIMDKRIYGVNYYGTKVFFEDGIYQLSEQLTVSQKLGDINIPTTLTQPIYPLNEKYYVRYNTTDDKVTIYEFNEDTNLFTEMETVNSGDISGYEQSPDLYYGNYVYDFIQGDTLIGYTVGGNNLYINADRSITTSSILNGYQAYNAQGSPIVGTMPNNGELNITPTTENQNIPEGYTSGGTVLGDENLKSENIKKDVSIFGVTGSLESSSGQIKLFETEEEMNQSTGNNENDIALVYYNKFVSPELGSSRFDEVMCPETVTLSQSVTQEITYGNRFTGQWIINSTSVTIPGSMGGFWGSEPLAEYTSTDGMNYTRTSFDQDNANMLSIPDDLPEIFLNFIKVKVVKFTGLYQYKDNTWQILETDLTDVQPDDILPNNTVYGKSGLVTGDDTVYKNLSSTKLHQYVFNDKYSDYVTFWGYTLDTSTSYCKSISKSNENNVIFFKHNVSVPDTFYTYLDAASLIAFDNENHIMYCAYNTGSADHTEGSPNYTLYKIDLINKTMTEIGTFQLTGSVEYPYNWFCFVNGIYDNGYIYAVCSVIRSSGSYNYRIKINCSNAQYEFTSVHSTESTNTAMNEACVFNINNEDIYYLGRDVVYRSNSSGVKVFANLDNIDLRYSERSNCSHRYLFYQDINDALYLYDPLQQINIKLSDNDDLQLAVDIAENICIVIATNKIYKIDNGSLHSSIDTPEAKDFGTYNSQGYINSINGKVYYGNLLVDGDKMTVSVMQYQIDNDYESPTDILALIGDNLYETSIIHIPEEDDKTCTITQFKTVDIFDNIHDGDYPIYLISNWGMRTKDYNLFINGSDYTGTISPTEYNTALETSKQILGVKEEVQ